MVAVSDLKILLPKETGIEDEIDLILLTSESVNPPSGPINTAHFLYLLKYFGKTSFIVGKFLLFSSQKIIPLSSGKLSKRSFKYLIFSNKGIDNLSDKKTLMKHQEEVLKSWEENNYFGLIIHATGSGKTITGVNAIKRWFDINNIASLFM